MEESARRLAATPLFGLAVAAGKVRVETGGASMGSSRRIVALRSIERSLAST